MRKSELVKGEHYAAGTTSRFDQWKLVEVELVEVDGERDVPLMGLSGPIGTRSKRGIVVKLMQDVERIFGWRGKAGDEKVLDSAREIHELWSTYELRKAEHDRKTTEHAAERRRQLTKRYADLAERFRAAPTRLADHELAELRAYARDVKNYMLERQATQALIGGGVVLEPRQAEVVGALLEVVRDEPHYQGALELVGRRVGGDRLGLMMSIDAIVDACARSTS